MLKHDNKKEQQTGKGPAEQGLGQCQPGLGPQIIRLIGELCSELHAKDCATCTALWAFQPYLSSRVIEGEAYKKIIHYVQEKKSGVQPIERIGNFIMALYGQLQKDFFIQDVIINAYIISFGLLRGLLRLPAPSVPYPPISKGQAPEGREKLSPFIIKITGVRRAPQLKKDTRKSESFTSNSDPS